MVDIAEVYTELWRLQSRFTAGLHPAFRMNLARASRITPRPFFGITYWITRQETRGVQNIITERVEDFIKQCGLIPSEQFTRSITYVQVAAQKQYTEKQFANRLIRKHASSNVEIVDLSAPEIF